MGFRNKTSCNTGGSGFNDSCYKNSSDIIYDGENFPEAGLTRGDSLNNVLANLARYVTRAVTSVGPVLSEKFLGTSGIVLSKVPAELLMVSYCGAVLPKEYYKMDGKRISFCKDFCRGDDAFSEVQVVYRAKSDSTYGYRC